jgi:hypothetical protein
MPFKKKKIIQLLIFFLVVVIGVGSGIRIIVRPVGTMVSRLFMLQHFVPSLLGCITSSIFFKVLLY